MLSGTFRRGRVSASLKFGEWGDGGRSCAGFEATPRCLGAPWGRVQYFVRRATAIGRGVAHGKCGENL